MNEVMKLIANHRSIRKYTDRQIDDETVREMLICAQSASTASFMQAYSIIRVNSPEKRMKISALAGNQKDIVECPLFLVFCADLNRACITCDMHDIPMNGGFTESFLVGVVDTALAAQNMMIAAESLGLGGVYIGGIRNDLGGVCEILGIPSNVFPLFGMCLGYPAESSAKKERLPIDAIFMTDTYCSTNRDLLCQYDARINEYYRSRDSSRRDDTWTKQISERMSRPQRPKTKAFLEQQGLTNK